MKVREASGIIINAGKKTKNIVVDARKKMNELKIISHCHSDHAIIRNDQTYFTLKENKALIERKQNKKKVVLKEMKLNKKIKKGEYTISLHESGHAFGATQILIENGSSLGITSDFKLEECLLFKRTKALQPETLLIESTFGKKEFQFKKREEIYSELEKIIKFNLKKNNKIILSGYALGKAQELTKYCNEFLKIIPFVEESVFEVNKVFNEFNEKKLEFELLNNNLKKAEVMIIPGNKLNYELMQAINFSCKNKVYSINCTGWNYKGFYDKIINLSDHADFKQLISYVEESNAKKIITYHGFSRELAHELRKKGFNARSINESQRIQEFF